jgi:hypothetical protein
MGTTSARAQRRIIEAGAIVSLSEFNDQPASSFSRARDSMKWPADKIERRPIAYLKLHHGSSHIRVGLKKNRDPSGCFVAM